LLLGVLIVSHTLVSNSISLFLRKPSALCFQFFLEVCIWSDRVFEVSLGHSAHVCVLEIRVEAVHGLDVPLGAEVNVGEAALVGALFADVHF
jgi:hypothetical protein